MLGFTTKLVKSRFDVEPRLELMMTLVKLSLMVVNARLNKSYNFHEIHGQARMVRTTLEQFMVLNCRSP